jgi:glucokinase
MHLVADIGGTHARFALADPADGALIEPRTVAAAEYPDIAAAIRSYLASVPPGPAQAAAVQAVALAVAAPVRGARIEFTNSAWTFDTGMLRTALGCQRLVVLNDFEALARSLRVLPANSLRVVKAGVPDPAAPRVVLGPGTGLGVAGLLPAPPDAPQASVRVLASQGGHVGFAPVDDLEIDLLRFMQARVGRVSAEHLLSGRGLVHLYGFFAARAGAPLPALTPAQVSERALAESDPVAREAVLRFWAMLGGFAADVALTFGAWDGVYLGGGIAPRLLPLLSQSDFIARFGAKQPMHAVLEPVPVWLIEDPHAALRGAAAALY